MAYNARFWEGIVARGEPVQLPTDDLSDPPTLYASVTQWAGIMDLEFDIEIWGNEASTITDLELMGAVQEPITLADDTVDTEVVEMDTVNVVDTDADTMTVTGHSYKNGDGPVQFVAGMGAVLPGGIEAETDYWLGVDGDDLTLYPTFADWMSSSNKIDITDAGLATVTIVDTADTQRVHWLGYGLLGYAGDGAVEVDEQRGYTARLQHRPRTIAYALVGSSSGEITATLYLVRTR